MCSTPMGGFPPGTHSSLDFHFPAWIVSTSTYYVKSVVEIGPMDEAIDSL